MRESRSVTRADPLWGRYGRCVDLLRWLPALCGEVFRTATVLAALGVRLRHWRPFSRSYAFKDLGHCSCHI
ncbi:high-affinity choline transporter 1-like [Haemaphysalis longicornis]